MTAYSLIAMLHAGLGVVALGSFWIAGLSRKGSPLHRGAGKAYLLSMIGIVASQMRAIALAVGVGMAWVLRTTPVDDKSWDRVC